MLGRGKCLPVILVILVLLSVFIFGNTNKKITIEAGTGLPSADEFLKNKSKAARYITDTSEININLPGVYGVMIESGGMKYNVSLEIVDTTAPKAVIVNLDLYESRNVEPVEFVKDINDITDVRVSYVTAPDYSKTGNQEIVLLLEDTSGNKTEYKALLRISKLKDVVQVEISNETMDAGILLKNQEDLKELHMDSPFIPDKLGDYSVKATIGNEAYESTVRVVDTTAPIGVPVDRKFWINDKIEAADFVDSIQDKSKVSVSFRDDPDFSQVGEQIVKILLVDEGKNEALLEAKLILEADTEPPKIYGVRDNIVSLNTPVAYKKGIYVIDNRDGEISFEVDSSKVNIRKEGSYPVIYSATDSSGNKTQQEVTYTVRASEVEVVEREVVEALANEILAKIIKDDMTMEEKALALYKYINKNVYYLGGRHSDDMITEAYYGMLEDPGDCYTYFAVSDLMLNMVGIPNIRVERLRYEGESNHYWHMINCGNGWYHFDPSIHKPEFFSFMLTDAEAEAYSRQKGKNAYYYRHDKEKYPATPTE